jgi:Family of unknown function (DUF5719)/FtsX extracellular domain
MTGRRLPLVVLLVGLLVAAIAVGDRRVQAERGVTTPAVAASTPAKGVRSSAWYCAGGPTRRGASADQVTISNVGSHPVRIVIDVMVAGHDVAEHFVTVAARSSTTVPVARLSPAPSAALVVEPLGGGVVVEQGYSANGDVAMAPCATRASSSWYFAAGSSVGGAQTWLSLFNPFANDAVVDVEAYSEGGFRAPGSLQDLVVGHGSRLAVRLDQSVAEQRIVAVAVHARNDSLIVATQSVVQPRPGAVTSASLSLGALAAARTWMFADNRSRAGAVQQLVLANPGDADTTASVSVVADVAAVIEPRVVRVPATTAVAVDFSGLVPASVSYTLVVHSVAPVVAETRDAYGGELPGLATEVGSTAASRRWSFAGGPFTATGLGGDRPQVPNGFDLAIVMRVAATDDQIAAVHSELARDPHVKSVRTVTRNAALAAFEAANRDNPALIASVTSAMMPVSFNVNDRADKFLPRLTRYFGSRVGVDAVVTAASQGPGYADDVVVLNPETRPVRISLVVMAGGSTLSGPAMTGVVVAPLHQVTISLLSLARTGVAVVVDASGPVVAERFTGGPWGVTRSPGVP